MRLRGLFPERRSKSYTIVNYSDFIGMIYRYENATYALLAFCANKRILFDDSKLGDCATYVVSG